MLLPINLIMILLIKLTGIKYLSYPEAFTVYSSSGLLCLGRSGKKSVIRWILHSYTFEFSSNSSAKLFMIKLLIISNNIITVIFKKLAPSVF